MPADTVALPWWLFFLLTTLSGVGCWFVGKLLGRAIEVTLEFWKGFTGK